MATFPQDHYEKRGERSFAAVHRDYWRLITRKPLVFILLPILAFVPVDVVIALVTDGMGTMQAIKTAMRVEQIASLVIGTYVGAVMLWTVRSLINGENPSFLQSLGGGKTYWGSVSITSFQMGWRISLATLLFIIPGIVVAVKYVFALPVTVFEDVHGKTALDRSNLLAKGSKWRIALLFLYAIAMYIPLIFAAIFLSTLAPDAEELNLWMEVLNGMPINLAFACLTMGTAVAYLEWRTPEKLQKALINASGFPVGTHATPMVAGAAMTHSTVLPAAIGLGGWMTAALSFYYCIGLATLPLVVGNYYLEKEQLEKARPYYDSAARMEPENLDIRFAVGEFFLNAEKDYLRAIEEFQACVNLDPENGQAHLFLATAHYFNNDFAQAKKSLEKANHKAGELNADSKDLLDSLNSDENIQSIEEGT